MPSHTTRRCRMRGLVLAVLLGAALTTFRLPVEAQITPLHVYLPLVMRHCQPTAAGCLALPATPGWYEIPNSRLRPVCAAENGFPAVWGVMGCAGITEAWSGGVFDTTRNRLIIWGGGHNDYYGNELYALDLDDLSMRRLNDPGLPVGSFSTCQEAIANGTQANSRHTYDGIEYLPNVDRMFVFSGSLACAAGDFGRDTWTFDFQTMRWQRMNPTGPLPAAWPGVLSAYDPNTGLVFVHDTYYLYAYNLSSDAYVRVSDWAGLGYQLNAAIDPKRKRFVIVGWDSEQQAGRVYAYDISNVAGNSARAIQTLNTSGGAALIEKVYPGLAYDPVTDRMVAWAGGNTVYSLNLDTNVWTPVTFPNGPGPQLQNGTLGRWQYSPASGVFVYYGSVDANAFVFRLP